MQKSPKHIHVVAAVIENTQNQVFIAKRPDHVHQGGLWEFPGGKVESNESATEALKRELFEELGIHIEKYEPLIQISHRYPDKSVFLDVWRVTAFKGEAHGKEGQPTQWINKNEFSQYDFPAANKAIITAAILPQHYLITPEPDFVQRDVFLATLENSLKNGVTLFQLRANNLKTDELETLFHEITQLNQSYNATFLINSPIEFAQKLNAQGVHLSSRELMSATTLPQNIITAASCHSNEEIEQAHALGIDFILVSPVLRTQTHPESEPIGWEQFKTLCKSSSIPVFALGGMTEEHLPIAINAGAQGIAGIRSLWCKPQ